MEQQRTSGKGASILMTSAAFVIVVAGMKAAQAILVPFLLALFITIITAPVLFWLRSKKLSIWTALIIIIFVIAIAGLLLAILVGNSINQFMVDLPKYQYKLQNLSNDAAISLEAFGIKLPPELIQEHFDPSIIMGLVGTMLQELGGLLANGFLIMLCAIFMLVEASIFPSKLKAAFGSAATEDSDLIEFTRNLKKYMAIKTAISILTGLLVWVWLKIVGVDYAELWATLAFLLNFVPNIGSVIAAVPAVLLSAVQFDIATALLVAFGYTVLNAVIGNFVEVRYMGKGLGLSTFIVFLSLIFWGWLLGPVGMLLSLPLTMMLRIGLDNNSDTRWLAVLLGPEPAIVGKQSRKAAKLKFS